MNADPLDWASLAPGRHDRMLAIGRLNDGSMLNVSYTVLVGQCAGPRVLITAGVHGDEYEGVRAVAELIDTLDLTVIQGTVVLVPVVNPPAFNAGLRVNPLDNVNLNRVFPGIFDGTLSERLAACVFQQLVVGAHALIDLHSGGTRYLFHPQAGFYRMPGGGAASDRSLAMARAFGLELVWDITHRAGVLSYEAMRAGIAAIGCEIGGNGRCEPAHVTLARHGVLNVLASLGVLANQPGSPPAQRIWRGDFTLAPAGGLFRADVALNQEVQAGERLYTLIDTTGAVCYERFADHAGLVSAIRIFGAIQEGEWDIAVLAPVID